MNRIKIDVKNCRECPKTKAIYYESTMGVKTRMFDICSLDKSIELNRSSIPDNCPLLKEE